MVFALARVGGVDGRVDLPLLPYPCRYVGYLGMETEADGPLLSGEGGRRRVMLGNLSVET